MQPTFFNNSQLPYQNHFQPSYAGSQMSPQFSQRQQQFGSPTGFIPTQSFQGNFGGQSFQGSIPTQRLAGGVPSPESYHTANYRAYDESHDAWKRSDSSTPAQHMTMSPGMFQGGYQNMGFGQSQFGGTIPTQRSYVQSSFQPSYQSNFGIQNQGFGLGNQGIGLSNQGFGMQNQFGGMSNQGFGYNTGQFPSPESYHLSNYTGPRYPGSFQDSNNMGFQSNQSFL